MPWWKISVVSRPPSVTKRRSPESWGSIGRHYRAGSAGPGCEPRVAEHETVGVELEVGREIARAEADTARREVLVALAVAADPEVGERDPGHLEVERAGLLVQAVAADRHHVGERREREVAVEHALELRRVRHPGPRSLAVVAQLEPADAGDLDS